MTWTTILALAGGTFLLKALGPVALGSRQLPPPAAAVTTLLPAALLAALVATQTVGGPGGLIVDARLAGVGVAAAAVALRAPFAVVVVVGTLVTALFRAAGVG